MGIDYDAWLEQPYQDQADWELAVEQFKDTIEYEDALDEWLKENPDSDEETFLNSLIFESLVEKHQNRY